MSAAPRLSNSEMTEAEWNARCDLAALYRICEDFGWTDLIDTHMSVRVPGEPNCLPDQPLRGDVRRDHGLEPDQDGHRRQDLRQAGGRFNAAGFTIHSGIYKARADVNCVMHTHTRAGGGVSLMEKGLRPISQDAISILDDARRRLSPLWRASDERGMRGAGPDLPAGQLCRAAEPWPPDLRPDDSRRLDAALHPGAGLRASN